MIPGVGSIGLASVAKRGRGSVVRKSGSSDRVDATSGASHLAYGAPASRSMGASPDTHHGNFIAKSSTAEYVHGDM